LALEIVNRSRSPKQVTLIRDPLILIFESLEIPRRSIPLLVEFLNVVAELLLLEAFLGDGRILRPDRFFERT